MQNYESAFDAYSRYLDSGGDSQATLKKAAAGRLSYAVALYENGDNDAADREYVRARQENEELAKLGDREAQVDMLGIDLNRASIISARGDQQGAIELLDETIAELKKLVDDPDYNRYEVPYCLAKAYMSKGWLLRSTFDDDLDCPEAIDSRDAYENAIKADSSDARLVAEYDQLREKCKVDVSERLTFLATHMDLVLSRDDATVQYVTCLNDLGRHDEALDVLSKHRFHPWEGGDAAGARARRRGAGGVRGVRGGGGRFPVDGGHGVFGAFVLPWTRLRGTRTHRRGEGAVRGNARVRGEGARHAVQDRLLRDVAAAPLDLRGRS